jgi:hypothetical protein
MKACWSCLSALAVLAAAVPAAAHELAFSAAEPAAVTDAARPLEERAAPEDQPGSQPPQGCVCGPAGACCTCCEPSLLDSLLVPGDRCFCDFISPMTNPVYFEDPRTLTEARFLFINHHTPAELGGDDLQLYALQVRAALSDRLSIVAAKDGFIVSDSPLVDDGWADVSAGLKYNLYRDCCQRLLVSAGFAYELPTGTPRALQGNGDGEFHLYLTGMADLGSGWHWMSGSGFRLPADRHEESQSWYWSNHLDRHLGHGLYGLAELNWYHWLRSGQRLPLALEGGDLFNLGSSDVAGNDIVTAAVGAKFKPHCQMEIGLAWEFPLTDRRDLLDNRLTFDWIVRY